MEALARNPLVHCVVADQCAYGLVTPNDEGNPTPALKPTRFMTSSAQMARSLSLRCTKDHVHQPLVSGRCAAAAYYPLGLVRAILQGMRDTTVAERQAQERDMEHNDMIGAVTASAGEIPMVQRATPVPLTSESAIYQWKVS